MKPMNYFDPENAAERYAKGRPDFHSNTISHIKAFLLPEQKLDKALDIACGTGLSSKALLAIAKNVYGTDTSAEMLKHAVLKDNINYSIAAAEQQPFPDHTFDLVTVCSAVHWFMIDDFLKEAQRLLKPHSWLVLYDNFFISEMEGADGFGRWFPEVYLKKFPSPVRNNTYSWTNENLEPKQLRLVKEEHFKNPVELSKEELILYFTTQSNITGAVGKGMNYAEIEGWLDRELSPFFKNKNRQIIYFGNWIRFLQTI